MRVKRWWTWIWSSNSGRLILALAAGLVFPLAFAPYELWPLALLALLLLHQTIHHAASKWHIVALCFVFALGKFGAGAYWIFVSLYSYAEVHLLVAIGFFVAFLLATAALFSVLALFTTKSRYPVLNTLVFASGITVVEILFSLPWAFGFPWLHLGYALIDTPLSIFAPLGGVWAVSFAGAVSAVGLSHLLFRHWQASVVAVVLWIPGLFLPLDDVAKGRQVSVALVQGNVPLEEKWQEDGWKNSLAKYVWLTNRVASVDLIVWPESAIPTDVGAIEDYLFDAVGELDGGLVFGALETRKVEGRSATFNVSVAVNQGTLEYFRKERLVPFGEYIPMRGIFGGLLRPLGYPMSSLTPYSAGQSPLQVGDLTLGTAICFEIAFPHLIRRRMSDADLIVVLSEDSWLGDTSGPWQHHQIAKMRALELNRPLVRATNDGITSSINASGFVVNQLPRFSNDVLEDSVVLQQNKTIFAQFGLLPITLLILLVLLAHAIAYRPQASNDA